MARLVGLVKPLSGYMALAILMGWLGHLCAAMITVFGAMIILRIASGSPTPLFLTAIVVFAVLRAGLRYGEQACNHFIAFKLLALIAIRSSAPSGGSVRQSWTGGIKAT